MNSGLRFWVAWGAGLALLLLLTVWALLQWNLNSYSSLVSDRLLLLAELRRGAVQEYFATADAELRFWSTNRHAGGPGCAGGNLGTRSDDCH